MELRHKSPGICLKKTETSGKTQTAYKHKNSPITRLCLGKHLNAPWDTHRKHMRKMYIEKVCDIIFCANIRI